MEKNHYYLDNLLVSILLRQGLCLQSLPLRVQIQELAREQSGDAEPEPGHGGCQEGREILKTLLVDINTRQVGFNCEIKYHLDICELLINVNLFISTHFNFDLTRRGLFSVQQNFIFQ